MIIYLLNLITMILMCISTMGILIIYLVVLIEGSMYVSPVVLVHLMIPLSVLILNIYTIMLEDHEEVQFFRRGRGHVLLNLAFLVTLVTLSLTVIYKIAAMESVGIKLGESDDYTENSGTDTLMEVEEMYLYGLAFIESLTLKEYVKSKLKDFLSRKKQ